MLKILRNVLIVCVVISAGYFTLKTMTREREPRVWVGKQIIQGEQCKNIASDAITVIKGDVVIDDGDDGEYWGAMFKQAGIEIFEKKVEQLETCRACGCPEKAFQVSFEIKKTDILLTQKFGFESL